MIYAYLLNSKYLYELYGPNNPSINLKLIKNLDLKTITFNHNI